MIMSTTDSVPLIGMWSCTSSRMCNPILFEHIRWSAIQVYKEHFEIRAKAIRNAYADLNSETTPDKRIEAILGAPSTANFEFPGSLGQVSTSLCILLNIHGPNRSHLKDST